MVDLIKITEKDGQQLVSARELHEFLGSKRHFADWIKQRIKKYDFIQNDDFTVHKFVIGKTIQIDYAITIDMAKELSMVENNEKGKQARKYFIQCEKKLKEIKASYMIQDPIERAKAWIKEQEEKLLLEQRIAEYEPKITYLDTILECQEAITVTQIAADYGLSAKALNKILANQGIQWKVGGQWILKGEHKEQGYTKSHTQLDLQGKPRLNTKWTQKGRLFIHNLLENRGIKAVMDCEVE